MAKTGASKANALTLREISDRLAVSVKKQGKKITSETAKLCYLAFVELMADEIKHNGKFSITNIGSFETEMRGSYTRNSFNVQTREYTLETVPEVVMVRFRPSPYIKGYINNKEVPLSMGRRNREVEKEIKRGSTRKELLEKEMKAKKRQKYEKLIQPTEIEVDD